MFPKVTEVKFCDAYGVVVDDTRDIGEPRVCNRQHDEPHFFVCRMWRGDNVNLTTSHAILHTLRGRLIVNLSVWVCPCGEEVPYDGADDGLFAVTGATVYTGT